MFGKRLTLFRLLGFEVRMDASWLILAWFVTWSLARGYFPTQYPNMPPSTYWWMGAAGALGLFLSLVFHELCHSLVATRYGIPMKGITLFIFGGVAEMDDEPPSAKAEFFMAGAGPLSSFFIGMVLYGLSKAGISSGLSVCVIAVIYYLAWLNLALAVFNLIPAFPLDGGRVLRATLWNWKKNFRWATNIAAQIGSGFGIVLIVLGIISFFRQNFIGGLWWFMIGIFVKNAAQMSYRQALTRKALEGEKVSRFMIANPITVPPSTSMEEFVNEYVYKYHFKMFPVVSWGKLLGCVTVKEVAGVDYKERPLRTVGDIAIPCAPETIVSPNDDAAYALSLMSRSGNSRLMVADGERLAGVIALKDMLNFLSLKIELNDL